MRKGRRIISAILLLCMIVSLIPPVSAETGVTYVLDKDGIEAGETYLIVRASMFGSPTTLRGDGNVSSVVKSTGSDTLTYVDGMELCEWTVEEYAGDNDHKFSLVYKNGGANTYVKLDGKKFEISNTAAPLMIEKSSTAGRYFVAYKTGGKYYGLSGTASYFGCEEKSSLESCTSFYFYKKEGGTPEAKTYTATVTTQVNGANASLDAIFGTGAQLHLQLDGGNGAQLALTGSNGVYKAEKLANGTYSVYATKDGIAKDTGYDVVINGADNGVTLSYYSVTVKTALDSVTQKVDGIDGVSISKGGNNDRIALTGDGNGTYTTILEEKGTYSVYVTKGGDTKDTGYDVGVKDGNNSVTLSYYSVTVKTALDSVTQKVDGIDGVSIAKDGSDDYIELTGNGNGTYTTILEEKDTFSVYVKTGNAYKDTNMGLQVTETGGNAELQYFSVTYSLNGGTLEGLQEYAVYPAGTQIKTPEKAPTKQGQTFDYWSGFENATYKPNQTITLNSAMVFSAVWKEKGTASYVAKHLVKGTYAEVEAPSTGDGLQVGSVLEVNGLAYMTESGYTYIGAEIGGKYYEKDSNPHIVLGETLEENTFILFYMPDPDLHLNKTATLEDDGTYTIELEMLTHDNPVTTIVDQDVPLDIVLVLDQSSSMYQKGAETQPYEILRESANQFIDLIAEHGRANGVDHRIAIVGYGSGDTTGAKGDGPLAGNFVGNATNTDLKVSGKYTNTGVFDAHGDFHSYKITGFNYVKHTGKMKDGETYYVEVGEGDNKEYVELIYHEKYRHLITVDEAYVKRLQGEDIYGYVDGGFVLLTHNNSDLWTYQGVDGKVQLYSSEQFFTQHEFVWTHRSGLEGREIHAVKGENGEFLPIDGHDNIIYTREETTAANPDVSIYKDALTPVTMGANGSGYVDDAFYKATEKIGARGQTYVSYGLEMADAILDTVTEEGRQKVVVVFTDGKPGDSSTFDEAESNKALDMSADIQKYHDAQIYTIGVDNFLDNPAYTPAEVEYVERSKQDQEDFLQALSSNHPEVRSLDELWVTTEYIPLKYPNSLDTIKMLNCYYIYHKVGNKFYQLDYRAGVSTENGLLLPWVYIDDNGVEQVAFRTTDHRVDEEGVIIDENGNEITLYRKVGADGYKGTVSAKYYHSANNLSQLSVYFATIVQELTTKISEETTMSNDAILRDIMGQGLVMTPDTVITVYKQYGVYQESAELGKYVAFDDNQIIQLDQLKPFEKEPDEYGVVKSDNTYVARDEYGNVIGQYRYISVYNRDAGNTTNPNGDDYHPHTIDIVGYDYLNDYIAKEENPKGNKKARSEGGYKLIVTITKVEAQDDVVWGRAQTTNHNQSGLWLRMVEGKQDRELLEAFKQPNTIFVERAYVLDYGKEFKLGGWYFDSEGENTAQAVHVDCEIENGMNGFDENNPTTQNDGSTGNTKYGNVRIKDGEMFYQPTTTQWSGTDEFYVFGDTWRNTVKTQDANRNGNLWNKVTVIPANNIYFEDTFVTEEGEKGETGTNKISGFTFTGSWSTVYTTDKNGADQNQEHPEHMEAEGYRDVHGWTDALADDIKYSDGSATVAGIDGTIGAKATLTFTGTGIDVYSRTTQKTGTVVAQLSWVGADNLPKVKVLAIDNLAMSNSGEGIEDADSGYFQIPTVSFSGLDYGTYTLTLIATVATATTGTARYEYYLDGVRIYNPLGNVADNMSTTVKNAYGKELNSVFTEIRDIALANGDFTPDLNKDDETGATDATGDTSAIGAVFIDSFKGESPTTTYDVATTFKTYGPKNEVYLAPGQAMVIKVNPKNTYYVGMKAMKTGTSVKVNVSGIAMSDPKTITVGHTTDMYYEVTPIVGNDPDVGYIVIQNASEDGALLALSKLRTTNMLNSQAGHGILAAVKEEVLNTVVVFEKQLEEAKAEDALKPETPDEPIVVDPVEQKKELTNQLFTAVRTWLQDETGGA